jgi:hypothetical protein
MTNYRIFLLSFLSVSWIFLCGLNTSFDNALSAKETRKTAIELKSVEANNTINVLKTKPLNEKSNLKTAKTNPQKLKPATINLADARVGGENNTVKNNEFEKPLDLSVPFKNSENADLKDVQKSTTQNLVANTLASETKKKPGPLELNGSFLMSPEPEVEKRKSLDGAGIVINLKR